MDLQKNTVKHMSIVFKNKKLQQIVIGICIYLLVYCLVVTSVMPAKYNLNEGDIAQVDIRSPKDVVNEYATNKLKEQAKDSVEKEYTTDLSILSNAVRDINTFFTKVFEIKALQNADEKSKVQKLKSESNISLRDEDYALAIKSNENDLTTLQSGLIDNISSILNKKIGNDEKEINVVKNDLSYSMLSLKLSKELAYLGTDIGYIYIKSNIVYDSKKTEDKIKEAVDAVEPVQIKKDQNIVKKGEVVTAEQLSVLKSLGLLEQQKKIDFLLYAGIGVLIALMEGLIIYYLYRFSGEILKDNRKLILISLIVSIELLLCKFIAVYNISGYLIPAALASMLVSILLRPRFALTLNVVLSILVTLMTGYNVDSLTVALIGGCTGAIVVSRMHQRYDLILAGAVVSIVDILSILSIGLINNADIITVLRLSVLGIINGGLSSVFAIGLLPFCETTFDIVTPIKLLELSNPNQPVLKKLLFEAPGTYHHSIIVGNLAEAAVDSIGGNSLLARVGAYYHDIGKIKRPYFFKENQLTNDNPHDKITPSLSTLIITNHIKDGLEMAKQYKLPAVIKDMIEQHHGTTLVKYFYIKAVNEGSSHDDITEDQFRYDGPRPQTREAAVIMIADSVEAAVRSIALPSKVKIEEMVKKIIDDKLQDRQLDECDLTLKDIDKIKTAFLNVLNGIYHDRIEYPDVANDKGEILNEYHGK